MQTRRNQPGNMRHVGHEERARTPSRPGNPLEVDETRISAGPHNDQLGLVLVSQPIKFFILRGKVLVFFEDGEGHRAEAVLGEWDCVAAPANVIHGFVNVGLEPAYLQVMLGKARPDLMTYADASLQARRDEHLTASVQGA